MDRYHVIEWTGAACLLATGLSHLLHPRAWGELFQRWARQGESGALVNGLMHAGVGGLFLTAHPVFVGWASQLTYWAAAVATKGLLYLVAPAIGLQSMRKLTPDRAQRMRWVGVPMMALGAAIAATALA